MKAAKNITAYRRLRSQPLWRLLAADNGPVIIGLLEAHLSDRQSSVPASVFYERISHDLEELRSQGTDLPQTAQAYAADWLSAGYIVRRFPEAATEEEFELSSATADAIRFIGTLVDRRTAATESRLAVVIQQLVQLAEETDTNPKTRIAALVAERRRIDQEIELVTEGKFKSLPDSRALERIREIISLAEDLTGDFRRVRDDFEGLNRDLRARIMDNDGSRGEILSALFAGVDVIAESEAGQTFSAFWRLLTDPEQNATFEGAIDEIVSRNFASHLETRQRRFLLRLSGTLLDQGGTVHEALHHFARSLKHFVQSREYLEQRRLNELLRKAQRTALNLKDHFKASETIAYELELTSCRLSSLSQWVLFDPLKQLPPEAMQPGEGAPIDLASISELVSESEIDFRTLKANIRSVLLSASQASIADVLDNFPAAQGLGSVVGLLALATRHAFRAETAEMVSWRGRDGEGRRARIPTMYFLRERADELL